MEKSKGGKYDFPKDADRAANAERRSSGVFERSERKRLALVLAGLADNAGGAGVDQESMG